MSLTNLTFLCLMHNGLLNSNLCFLKDFKSNHSKFILDMVLEIGNKFQNLLVQERLDNKFKSTTPKNF